MFSRNFNERRSAKYIRLNFSNYTGQATRVGPLPIGGNGSHNKWQPIRLLWIWKNYRTLWIIWYPSYILARNRKVKFKSPNKREQQGFGSIHKQRKNYKNPTLTKFGQERIILTPQSQIDNRDKRVDPQWMSLCLTRLQGQVQQIAGYLPNAQV